MMLAIFIAVDVYAYQAVVAWSSPWRPARRKFVRIAYWVLSLLAYAAVLLNVFELLEWLPRNGRLAVVGYFFLLFLAKLPMIALLLLDDLRRGITWIVNKVSPVTKRDTSRSRFMAKAALVAGGVPVATLTYGIVRNAYRYRRFAVDVPIKNLPPAFEGYKIVQISDMHSGSWTRSRPLHDAIALINGEDPDMVCMTGDLVNNSADEMQPFVDIFKQIKAKDGVFSVLGNHDYGFYERSWTEEQRLENMDRLYATHAAMGWDLLRDENRIIERDGQKLAIMGVENWGEAFRFPRRANLPKAYAGTEECDCRVLMSHDPTHWDAKIRPNYPDIDLTLSGHTHGFQFGVEIPGFKWSPAQYLYKQWAGLYREGEQFLYVNRGLGFLGYPGRVGILPEVTVLTLRSA